MNLTLEVVSPNGQTLGAARRKLFGPEGGRIGRSPDCDWVLANPYVSRHHATVRWTGSAYSIESTGENGVAVNAPQAMLARLERHELKSGDRLFIDEYEITVSLEGASGRSTQGAGLGMSGASALEDHPFADIAAPRRSTPRIDPFEPAPEDLDPLRQLAGTARVPALDPGAVPPSRPQWNHTPGINDQFTPPPVPSLGPAIPDDWDKTTFGKAKGASPAPPLVPGSSSSLGGAVAPAIPDDWDKTTFGARANAAPAPGPARTAAAPAPRPRAAPEPDAAATTAPRADHPRGDTRTHPPKAPASTSRAPTPEWPLRQGAPPQPAAAPERPVHQSSPGPSARQPPVNAPAAAAALAAPSPAASATAEWPAHAAPAATPAQTVSRSLGFDTEALIRAAGLDPVGIPPETSASLGVILRSVVQGIIEVLHARAEIKNQFRLPLTRVKTKENNPLKFAVNAEDALQSLLGRRNPAYLPPVEAFEDALEDIRFHQLAMLAGMRAGFESVMKQFDPGQLQEIFDRRGTRGGLLGSAKSKYWELYAEQYGQLAGDRETAFRRLFGEEFASEYEKQLDTLKRSHGKLRRG
ncbi:MAG: type VI secretion system-associated FHA domain protein TagH [Steroidobacteraceae bacterium]